MMSNIIYTTSIMHVSSEMVCVFVWTGKNYSNTQWRISVKYAVGELIIWLSLFSHAIGQFAVRKLLYGPKFLKKMLISEL